MSVITTNQCKKFLAELFTQKPFFIVDIYGDDYALSDACNPAKWKREIKQSAQKYFKEYSSNVYHKNTTPSVEVFISKSPEYLPLSSMAIVRVFTLDPEKYDSSVSFIVLEDKTGVLHLGEYVGD